MYLSISLNFPRLLDRAPITAAACITYLVTQLSKKIRTQRPSASEITRIPCIGLHIATMKEALKEMTDEVLQAIVEGAGSGFNDWKTVRKL